MSDMDQKRHRLREKEIKVWTRAHPAWELRCSLGRYRGEHLFDVLFINNQVQDNLPRKGILNGQRAPKHPSKPYSDSGARTGARMLWGRG